MKAKYANLLARQYRYVISAGTLDQKDLFTYVYPKIYSACGRGETKIILTGSLSTDVQNSLVRDKFLVVSTGNTTVIDWSFKDET